MLQSQHAHSSQCLRSFVLSDSSQQLSQHQIQRNEQQGKEVAPGRGTAERVGEGRDPRVELKRHGFVYLEDGRWKRDVLLWRDCCGSVVEYEDGSAMSRDVEYNESCVKYRAKEDVELNKIFVFFTNTKLLL